MHSKSAWLLPEYVNACYPVAKVVCCCPRQVMDAQSACCAIKPPALPTPHNQLLIHLLVAVLPLMRGLALRLPQIDTLAQTGEFLQGMVDHYKAI